MPLATNGPAELVADAFGRITEVDAVALAGSGVTGAADEQSDLDLYVYAEAPIDITDRTAIATEFRHPR